VIRPIEIIQLVGQILEKYRQAMAYQIKEESGNITEDLKQLEKEIQKDKFELMLKLGMAKRPPKSETIASIELTNKN